jgi:hypothetical protein
MTIVKTDIARNRPAWLSGCALRTIVPQRGESSPIESPLIGREPRLTNYGKFFANPCGDHRICTFHRSQGAGGA